MTELAILVPVLRRPHRVEPLLESVKRATPWARVLFVADEDDTEELEAIDAADAQCLTVESGARYARKINAGFDATSEELFFTGADDLLFHPGWFGKVQAHLLPGIDVVGTNDLCNPRTMRGQHSTHSLVRRSYIEELSGVVDEPGKVFWEGYEHEYCDDEFVQTAIARKRYAHAFDAYVEHLHPMNGKAPDDETYQRGREGTMRSRYLFSTRRAKWLSESLS